MRLISELDHILSKVGDSRQQEEYYIYVLPDDRTLDSGQGMIGRRAGTFLAMPGWYTGGGSGEGGNLEI